jgi:hypothetical protein
VALKICGSKRLSNPTRERLYRNRSGALLDATQTGEFIAERTEPIPGIATNSDSKERIRRSCTISAKPTGTGVPALAAKSANIAVALIPT